MAKVEFKEYLHDEWEDLYMAEQVWKKIKKEVPDFELDFDAWLEQVGHYPFYEVTLTCEYDTETGQIVVTDTAL